MTYHGTLHPDGTVTDICCGRPHAPDEVELVEAPAALGPYRYDEATRRAVPIPADSAECAVRALCRTTRKLYELRMVRAALMRANVSDRRRFVTEEAIEKVEHEIEKAVLT